MAKYESIMYGAKCESIKHGKHQETIYNNTQRSKTKYISLILE